MSIGRRYLRLWERLGAVIGYVVIMAVCLPFTVPLAGFSHLLVVLIALHLAATGGRRVARGWGERRAVAVIASPDGDELRRRSAAAASDPQALVRALGRMPATTRDAWLSLAGDLPHRCGTTVRDEVERQGLPTGDGGLAELVDLAARVEWPQRRGRMRLLAFAPNLVWLVLTLIAIAGWPTPGSGWFIGLVTLFCAIGLGGMTAYGFLDESRGHRAAVAAASTDW